jgi:autotransporter translocation and assembly factor TamB
LKEGTIGGEIAITQSRFFKEIDILPIGLPGKPKPAPKSARSEPVVILPPPLDKWKIDLRIRTRPDDPFLVRGNVANGAVSMDLRVGNTGSQPWLDGAVTIDRFTGNLPFSTLTVENGHVYFTQNEPLLPVLDIQAQSRIRDYTVTAYIFGNAYQPQITFSSEPPLPHADIVSLLATGSTTSDISGNADVLASRAALLAVQSIWRKIFKPKKGASAPVAKSNGQGVGSFLDRFDLELGATDVATGAREATTKIRINDQLYLLGELDTQGRYTGSLKYLLRFR